MYSPRTDPAAWQYLVRSLLDLLLLGCFQRGSIRARTARRAAIGVESMEREVDLTDQRPHVSNKGSVLVFHKRMKSAWNLLDQLLKICCNRAATNLQHSKRAVLRLTDVPHTQDVLVDRLQPSHESVWLRHFEVGRQCLAVAEAGGKK